MDLYTVYVSGSDARPRGEELSALLADQNYLRCHWLCRMTSHLG